MLFNETIFGPVKSRRLGTSLGVNLLPTDGKVCTFDCIYCECGLNAQGRGGKLPSREEVTTLLEQRLQQMKADNSPLDVITFAGNGEPTVHPQFAEVIEDTIRLRNCYYPNAKVSVLSNSTRITDKNVFNALKRVDNNILKLDSAIDATIRLMNVPNFPITADALVEQLAQFDGNVIIQTMFLNGTVHGKPIDNTTEKEVSAWLNALKIINPKTVMIYSIDRPTPEIGIAKMPIEKLQQIAKRATEAGFEVTVS